MNIIEMMHIFVAVVLGTLGGLLSLRADTTLRTQDAQTACIDETTQLDDLNLIIDRYVPVFDRESWKLTLQDQPEHGRMTATWQAWLGSPEGTATVDVLIWPCGHTDADLEAFYSDDGIEQMFVGWDKHSVVNRCSVNDIRMINLVASYNDQSWIARYWVEVVSPTRVLGGFAAVPDTEIARLDAIGEQLYPGAGRCPVGSEGEDK